MRIAKFFLLASLLVAAAACAPKQKEAAEPSALDVIFSRKSVRSYTDQAVTDEQVETLLRAAMAAPTGMNVQPWRFVVVRDQEVKDALAGPRGGMIAQAPVVFVVCGETTMMRKPWGQPDAEAVEVENGNWALDCSAAAENLLLAAEALGVPGRPLASLARPLIPLLPCRTRPPSTWMHWGRSNEPVSL